MAIHSQKKTKSMSALKDAIKKVVRPSSSRTSLTSSLSAPNGTEKLPVAAGHRFLGSSTESEGEEAQRNAPTQIVTRQNGRPSIDSGTLPRKPSLTELKVERKEERAERDAAEAQARRERQQKMHDEDPLRDHYGDLEVNSPSPLERLTEPAVSLCQKNPGDVVAFRARVHHIRPLGSKIVFLILRHQLTTIQAVIEETPDVVSHNMVRWSEGLNRETIVLVEGTIQKPPEGQGQVVKSTTVHKFEILVSKLFVVSAPTAHLPYQIDDVSKNVDREGGQGPRVGDRTRLSNRALDLRAPQSQAIFRIRSGICSLFRDFLSSHHFIEIQSSKFQESSTESGAEVFKVDYFRRPAFLAQSPQLAKQMCIAADMERVFEIGPVFRAENSNTHRHLTEFTGLDLEMAIQNNYSEVLDIIDGLFLHIFRGLKEKYKAEIDAVKAHHPFDDFQYLEVTPRLKFAEGVRLLRESGFKEDDGSEPSEWEDLSTAAERHLGKVIKEKYGTDYYILDKFPSAVRPFYTMPDGENPKLSNSFDIFMRGEEVLSGGQRIHNAPMLEEKMQDAGIALDTMTDYLNGFRWGCPPHGGGGVGLERVVMLYLSLGDVRWASLFPRDPKSFASSFIGQDLGEASMAAANAIVLRGPESSTFVPGVPHGELPPLENLIAKYGDSTNTSWVDPSWTVWRDGATGAAIGFVPQSGFAIVFGNPLCESKIIPRVVRSFLSYLSSPDVKLKPIWCCVSKETEHFLATELGWSAVIVVAEERVNPIESDPASHDKTVRRKIHRAEREGVKIVEVEGEVSPELRKQIEERCEDWSRERKGRQVHLTGVRPFDDIGHRKYFYAVDKEGKICCLVVLAQLSPKHGFQIKWALEFPDAPLGAIEYILTFVIKKLGDAGVRSATFGAGATGTMHPAENLRGLKVRTLEKTYNGISHTFRLSNKGDFRSKFGIEQEPLYLCYPKGGLGLKGVEAIMAMLQAPK